MCSNCPSVGLTGCSMFPFSSKVHADWITLVFKVYNSFVQHQDHSYVFSRWSLVVGHISLPRLCLTETDNIKILKSCRHWGSCGLYTCHPVQMGNVFINSTVNDLLSLHCTHWCLALQCLHHMWPCTVRVVTPVRQNQSHISSWLLTHECLFMLFIYRQISVCTFMSLQTCKCRSVLSAGSWY